MEPDLQRIDLKVFADAPPDLNLDPFLAIFGRWRHDAENPAQWVDLADYAHMLDGPGVIIVGKQGNFGVNLYEPGPGLLYVGKKDYQGPNDHRILEVFRRHLALATALLAEPDYPPELKVQSGSWELAINDRLNFPNHAGTDQLLRPAIESALNKLFGAGGYRLARVEDAQRRYGYSIRAEAAPELSELLEKAGVGRA